MRQLDVRLILCAMLGFCAAGFVSRAESNHPTAAPGATARVTRPGLPFQVGEKLTYHFYWGLFMVGRGVFEVTEIDKDGNHVFTVRVKSNDFIATIFPVDDTLQSFFDSKRGRSVRFRQDRRESKDHIWEETFFYPRFGQGSTESYVSGERKWFEIPKAGAQDKLSTIYFMRCLDWGGRKEASTVIGNDKGSYEVKFTRLKTETIKLDDFTPIPTFEVQPNTEYLRGFVKNGKMWVWVSDDALKIPVRVAAKLSIGTVSAVLVRVEGAAGWSYDPK